ncbi:hypothetical protein EGT74_04225 [Chitinophaga lutea]|uniref:Uncharacterized protein n=1 Tax=Chitinophaga lutea TaxID=2488634 RepID=A0A3N4PXU3_9BACT|nr:hypothetical protein [Chitinophaga lutea]RPE12758.1 hypothetical protein EGT74_04225 [Chitinophaga lutea]
MKKNVLLIVLFLPLCAQAQSTGLSWLGRWFNAWELVSKELLALPVGQPPEMVFYDTARVYTTSGITAPTGTPVKGPALYGRQLSWKVAPHGDSLTLPDAQRVPVGLMSFAAADKRGNSFFVMAAPSFWKNAGIESRELSLDKMLTGVFLHEFTHTRQYNSFGVQVDAIEREHPFTEVQLNDDIVQGYFKSDSEYVRAFRAETDAFYAAAGARSVREAKVLAKKALGMLKARQARYFTGNKTVLKKLDDIFLSMEGLGQYVAVYWLVHPRGGNLPPDVAVNGFRRKRNQWSQEEGLAMFLALVRLAKPDWEREQFSAQPVTIVELLEKAL